MVIVGRAGRPEGGNRDEHRASIVAAVGMGEQVWDQGKYIKGEKASCQIRTEGEPRRALRRWKGQPMDQEVQSTQFLRRKRT